MKIAIIIAFKDFRDEEYFETKEILEKAGFETSVFSNKKGIAIGKFGGEALIENTFKDLDISKFDGLLIVGGSGAIEYLDNPEIYFLINEAKNQKKIIAAICIAPLILAHAGILKGKKATVWSSDLDKSALKEFKKQEVKYVSEKSVVDGKIVTADGPSSIVEFCKNIINLI
ncbi:MAG: DJ-1/PfpI family protein [Candidatus Pacebacteria bacterium]|nr:DJ-1/PfpI family protein [Candidatus Paceibacterota bacterium]